MAKIIDVFVFITTKGKDENILCFKDAGGKTLPLVCTDLEQVAEVIGLAETMCEQNNENYTIRHYALVKDFGRKI